MLRRVINRSVPRPLAGTLAYLRASSAVTTVSTRHQGDVPARRPLHIFDNYLSRSSGEYIESLYLSWLEDRASVDPSWDEIFSAQGLGNFEEPVMTTAIRVLPTTKGNQASVRQSLSDCARLTWMVMAFEERGHLLATTDPLNYDDDPVKRIPSCNYREMCRLDLGYFGFNPEDATRSVMVGFRSEVGGLLEENAHPMTIQQLHVFLARRYCGPIGFELSHIADEAMTRFLRDAIETESKQSSLNRVFTVEDKKWIWDQVSSAVHFEDYFKRKYSSQKRFGLDGAETLVVGLQALFNRSASLGVEHVFMGQAHRGRLNVLHHLAGKPFEVILKEFIGVNGEELAPFQIQSDVKYHLGYSGKLPMRNGQVMKADLLWNASHLETVNPVVQGRTSAAQFARDPVDGKKKIIPIEIHGDAAFAGQGVVYETMGISEARDYGTGGTIHVVVNNQIGFTTDPKNSRSSAHCTDIGKTFQCPIFHVNGDSPEDVVRAFELAADFRAKFNKSVVLDLVCYRRFGHNENDDPSITQPLMYDRIKNHPDVYRLYSESLIKQGVITPGEVTVKSVEHKDKFGSFVEAAEKVVYADFLRSVIPEKWRGMKYSDELGKVTFQPTAVAKEQLAPVIQALKACPEGFQINKKLVNVLDRRTQTLETGEGIEWGTAEALAFGTLLNEGVHVRVAGQDVERATFSQRHAVLHDQSKVGKYTPLQHISKTQAAFKIFNSTLSEYGVLGYCTGYANECPNSLVIWEAQYGDFANGAAIMFDQFISAGETKWNQMQSVVVTMPHGYDGKGPEHSSGRIERFLQGSCEDVESPAWSPEERHHRVNWEIVMPTTPAQYFHVLRRHVKRDFRKPLIIFFSKQFLRAPNVSSMSELTSGAFQSIILDPSVAPSACRRLIMCSGQVYHLLHKQRQTLGAKDIAIVRIEELSPFPVAEVLQLLSDYSAAELMWVQEETRNAGAWNHVEPRIEFYTEGKRPLLYVGRAIDSSPSTGFSSVHAKEQEEILAKAFA